MAKLLAKNGRLKSRGGRLVRNDPACKTGCCGPGADCCTYFNPGTPEPAPGATPNTCGRSTATHIGCVTALDMQWDQRVEANSTVTTTELLSSGGPVFRTTTVTDANTEHQTESVILNGPNSGTGNCFVGWQVPVRVRTTLDWTMSRRTVQNELNSPPRDTTITDGGGTGSEIEDCVGANMRCPPVGGRTVQAGEDVAIWPIVEDPRTSWGFGLDGVAFPTSRDETITTTSSPGCSQYHQTNRQTFTRSLTWTGSTTGLRLVFTETRSTEIVTTSTCAIPGAFGTRTESSRVLTTSTRTASVTGRLGWDTACDGTAGPATCTPVATVCQPNLTKYIIGEPCGGQGGRPVVLPAFLVTACGYISVSVDGVTNCYRFSPSGLMTTNPFGLRAVIASERVDANSAKSCCECNTFCPKTDLSQDPRRSADWLNGSRNGLNGAWTTSPAAVAGSCCCQPDDRIRMAEAWSTLETYNDVPANDLVSIQRADMIVPADPLVGVPDFVTGIRRDATHAQYGIRLRLIDGPSGQVVQDIGIGRLEMFGPVGCEYGGFTGGVYSFTRPLDLDGGFNPRDSGGAPYPVDAPSDGQGGSSRRCIRYSLSATCQGMTVEGEWVQLYPSGRVQNRIRAKQVIVITPSGNVSGPCSGGCSTQQSVPVATNGSELGPVGPGPDLRSLLGGV